MTPEEIKEAINVNFEIITFAKKRVEELQAICQHEKIHEGLFSWRVGCTITANICDYCNKPILNGELNHPEKLK